MVGGDGVGDALEQHRLTGTGRRYDQTALPFTDWGQQVHHAAGVVVADRLELEPLIGIQRRQVIEEDLVAGFLWRFEVDGVDFDQGEVALAFLGRADLAADGIAGAQIETADLAGRDVDIVGTGQVVVLGGAQEAEAIRQTFEYAFAEDQAALLGLGLEDFEDQLLLTQAGGARDVHRLGDVVELLNGHVLQLDQVERRGTALGGLRGALFAADRAQVFRTRSRVIDGLGGGRRGGCRGRRRGGNGRGEGLGLCSRFRFSGRLGLCCYRFGFHGFRFRMLFGRFRFRSLRFRRRSGGGCRFGDALSVRLFRRGFGGAFAGGCFFGGLFGLFLRQVRSYRD